MLALRQALFSAAWPGGLVQLTCVDNTSCLPWRHCLRMPALPSSHKPKTSIVQPRAGICAVYKLAVAASAPEH
jgi:hypothetical protein